MLKVNNLAGSVLMCYLVNGAVKLALVVTNAVEKKSETVAPELSWPVKILLCLGCRPPGSGWNRGRGVTSLPFSSNTYKWVQLLSKLLFSETSTMVSALSYLRCCTCTVCFGVCSEPLSRTLLSPAKDRLFRLTEAVTLRVVLWFTRSIPDGELLRTLEDLTQTISIKKSGKHADYVSLRK